MDYQRIANDLLTPIWRGIPADYKRQYARNIWEQFENNVRSAAYTSSLRVWFDTLSRRLNVTIRTEFLDAVQGVLGAGDDRAILKALRDETAYVVLLVRVANEERKAEAGVDLRQTAIFDLGDARHADV
jgi:hypothetical protein